MATGAAAGRRARYFYDCEFIEDGRTIDLVSLGVVAQDGREFYAVSSQFDAGRAGPWVAAHVLPRLPPPSDPAWKPPARIRSELLEFLCRPGDPIELWAWCVAYDHVALGQLWGDMTALPRAIPRFTHEIKQHWELAGCPEVPGAGADRHHALADARVGFARWRRAEEVLRTLRAGSGV